MKKFSLLSIIATTSLFMLSGCGESSPSVTQAEQQTQEVKIKDKTNENVISVPSAINADFSDLGKSNSVAIGQDFDPENLIITNEKGEDISKLAKVEVQGNVNPNIPGDYPVTIAIEIGGEKFFIKKIITVKKNTPPVIHLKGEKKVSIYTSETYNDAGATAEDKEDGDLTDKINVSIEKIK